MRSAPLFVGGAYSALWITIASDDGGGNSDTVTCSAPRFVEGLDEGAQHRIERPTRFELMINLKTVKALGLTIPEPLLFGRMR